MDLKKTLNNSQIAQAFEYFIDHPTSVSESLLDLTTADFFPQLRARLLSLRCIFILDICIVNFTGWI